MRNRGALVAAGVAAAVLILLFSYGCGKDESGYSGLSEYVKYGKDSRTNQCFAFWSPYGFAHVPCTEEVLQLVK